MTDPTSTNDPPPTPDPRRTEGWWRSSENRYLAGVAGGLGERYAIDPMFIRIGFVLATLLIDPDGWFSFVPFLYGLAWVLLPLDRGLSVIARLKDDYDARRELAGAAALFLSASLLLPRLGPDGSAGLRFGFVLFGVAVLLLAGRRGGQSAGAAAGDPGQASPSGADDPAETGTSSAGGVPPSFGRPSASGIGAGWKSPPWGGPPPPSVDDPPPMAFGIGSGWRSPPWGPSSTSRRPRPPRRGPALWPLTVALLIIYVVVCVVLDSARDGIRPGMAVSGALLIVGAVLVLSGWRGRARSTVLIGLALLPVWVAFSPADIERYDGSGERILHPTTVDGAAGPHTLGYGRLELDLRDVELDPGQVLRSHVLLTGGVARVVVPADTKLVVQGHVGLGSVRIEGVEPWDRHEEIAVNQTVSWRTGPQPLTCDPVRVAESSLGFSGDSFDSFADLSAEFERREWEPPPPPRLDELTGQETMLVSVDERYALCDDSLPEVPPDPATIVLNVTLGLADLEVDRVRTH